MIMKTKLLILGLFVFGFAISIDAQTTTPNIKKEQIKQQKCIAHGVKTGELTRKETAKLKKQQASVNFTKRKAKADGVVTKKERAKIHAEQAQLSKQICVKKNNEVTR